MVADWALDAAIVALAASMAKDATDLRSSGLIDAENVGTWLPCVAMSTSLKGEDGGESSCRGDSPPTNEGDVERDRFPRPNPRCCAD